MIVTFPSGSIEIQALSSRFFAAVFFGSTSDTTLPDAVLKNPSVSAALVSDEILMKFRRDIFEFAVMVQLFESI